MKLENVKKRYGEKVVLSLSAELKEGEITAVLGESGAGKTTLLNVIAGLTSYEGLVDGVCGEKPVRREGCSYLFQEAKLLPNLTVEENLKFVLPQTEWEKIPSALEQTGLAGKERAFPKTLSGGERQRVSVARALLYPHTILLMDEPFSSLDLALKRSLMQLIAELWKDKTVLFVTHDVHEAALLARRALVIREGQVVLDLAIPAPYPRNFFERSREEEELFSALLRDR